MSGDSVCITSAIRTERTLGKFSFRLLASGLREAEELPAGAIWATAHATSKLSPKLPIALVEPVELVELLAGVGLAEGVEVVEQSHEKDDTGIDPPPPPSSPKWSVPLGELEAVQLAPGQNVIVVVFVPASYDALQECPEQEAQGFVVESLHVVQGWKPLFCMVFPGIVILAQQPG